MGETKFKKSGKATEDVIKAFDRERAEAHEHRRRLTEQLKAWREYDRPVQHDNHQKS